MQDRLNALLVKNWESIKVSVAELGKMLADIAAGAAADPLSEVQTAEALAHQLKGSSGTAGFHDVCRAATMLDDYLKVLCRGDAATALAGISGAVSLFHTLDRIAQGTTPGSSRLYQAA
jgi:chemotaxis protein histidine kinase CheA